VIWNLHGVLERVLLLLKELSGHDWLDGCKWAIRYSVQNKNLRYDGSFFPTLNYDFILPFVYVHCIFRSSTIELFKQHKDYYYYNNDALERIDPLDFGRYQLHFIIDEVSFCFLMT